MFLKGPKQFGSAYMLKMCFQLHACNPLQMLLRTFKVFPQKNGHAHVFLPLKCIFIRQRVCVSISIAQDARKHICETLVKYVFSCVSIFSPQKFVLRNLAGIILYLCGPPPVRQDGHVFTMGTCHFKQNFHGKDMQQRPSFQDSNLKSHQKMQKQINKFK